MIKSFTYTDPESILQTSSIFLLRILQIIFPITFTIIMVTIICYALLINIIRISFHCLSVMSNFIFNRADLNVRVKNPSPKSCDKYLLSSVPISCGSKCDQCCELGGKERLNFVSISLGKEVEISRVEVSICCEDYKLAKIASSWKGEGPPKRKVWRGTDQSLEVFRIPTTPSVSLSQVSDPFEDFVTLHLENNVSYLAIESLSFNQAYSQKICFSEANH